MIVRCNQIHRHIKHEKKIVNTKIISVWFELIQQKSKNADI